MIFHSDKREQCGSFKSCGHFLYDDPLFLKGNRIVLSIDYHPKTFSFFYFFAFDICRGAVYIQSKLSSLHFIRDNVRLLITIPQSFADSQHNAHNNIIIAHFNNFKANFSSTSLRQSVKRSYMVIYILLLFEFDVSISNLEVIDILSDCKRLKNVLIKALWCQGLISLWSFREIIIKLIVVGVFWAYLPLVSRKMIVIYIRLNSSNYPCVIFILMNDIFFVNGWKSLFETSFFCSLKRIYFIVFVILNEIIVFFL